MKKSNSLINKTLIATQILSIFVLSFVSLTGKAFAGANPVINGPASLSATLGHPSLISGVSIVSGGNPSVDVRLFVQNGFLSMTETTGLTFTEGQEGSLQFTGNLQDINAGLASLHYLGKASSDTLEISLTAPGEIFDPVSNHIYEFVSVPTGIDWNDANADAQSRTKYGLTGYLVTITSEHENDFITDRMLVDGWMGASDEAVDGDWKWVTGPEAGTSFWSGLSVSSNPPGTSVDGQYSNWLDVEPNNWGGDEDCGQFYAQAGEIRGTWNDLSCNDNGITGYIVEYGAPENTVNIENKSIPITSTPNEVNVSNCDQLMAIDDEENNEFDNISLTADINCTGKTVAPLFPEAPYKGTFDGQSHSINGYELTTSDSSTALFSETNGATIKNLDLLNGHINSTGVFTGSLIGSASDTTVDTVTSDWDIQGSNAYTGGLIGYLTTSKNKTSTVKRSAVKGSTVGENNATGGLIGWMESNGGQVLIEQNYTTGSVQDIEFSQGMGGLIGFVSSYPEDEVPSVVTIQDNYSQGNVTGHNNVGGLIGDLQGYSFGDATSQVIVRRNYASGNVTGSADTGGLIGNIAGSGSNTLRYTIRDNFAAGQVISDDADTSGGLVGVNGADDPIPTSPNNFFDLQGTNRENCGGDTSLPLQSCTGIDTEASPNYFKNNHVNQPMASWNFSTIWYTNPGEYPTFGIIDDNDGIDGEIEDAAPNNGDANNDGISDSAQSNVASFLNTHTNSYMTLEVPSSCSIKTVSNPSANTAEDNGFTYPFGMLSFTIDCDTDGATVSIKHYYYGDYNASDYVIKKYNTATHLYTAISEATIENFAFGSNKGVKAVYQITDGGVLDEDGSVNGLIVDPAGLAAAASANQTPGVPGTGLPRVVLFPSIISCIVGLVAMIWSLQKEKKI